MSISSVSVFLPGSYKQLQPTANASATMLSVNANNRISDFLTISSEAGCLMQAMEARMEQMRLANPPRIMTVETYYEGTLVSTYTRTDRFVNEGGTPHYRAYFSDQEITSEGKKLYADGMMWNHDQITYKATFAEGEKIVAEYESKNKIVGYAPWHMDQHGRKWLHGENTPNFGIGDDAQEGDWLVLQPLRIDIDAMQKGDDIGILRGGKNSNSFSSLGKMLGLEGTFNTKESFLSSLDKLIDSESAELTSILGKKLGDAKLGDVTKKITFAEDKDGNIVVEGNISAKKKRELAKAINDDPELVDRIKTQKARIEIAEELKKDGQIDEKTGKVNKADLAKTKFDAARTQLLKHFLNEHGFALDDVETARLQFHNEGKIDERFNGLVELLNSFPELSGEVEAYKERVKEQQATPMAGGPGEAIKLGECGEKSTAVRSLLAMKRGELSEATDEEPKFGLQLSQLRAGIRKTIDEKYNEMYRATPDMMIADFKMKFDHNGKLQIIDVQTFGNDPDANKRAEKTLNAWFAGSGQELGLAMLEAHDDEHGDVQEFKHEIIATGFDYEVLSPDADKAALEEMDALTQEIGSALGDFFGKTMGITNPFEIVFGSDGLLSLGEGALSGLETQSVQKVLADINKYLTAEDTGEETEGMLNSTLTGIADKFVALKEVMEKFHDKSLMPKEVQFGVNM